MLNAVSQEKARDNNRKYTPIRLHTLMSSSSPGPSSLSIFRRCLRYPGRAAKTSCLIAPDRILIVTSPTLRRPTRGIIQVSELQTAQGTEQDRLHQSVFDAAPTHCQSSVQGISPWSALGGL